MRGLIPAHCMHYIEELTGLQMAEMIDVFCGPSTASILNAAMNIPAANRPYKPKFKARHMVRFYEREGIKIFPPDRFRDFRGFIHDFNNRTMKIGQLNTLLRQGHYDTAHLKRSLRAMYGEHRLSETVSNLVIPVYNIDRAALQSLEDIGEDENTPVHTKNNISDEGGHAVWLKNIRPPFKKPATSHVSLFDAVLASCAAPTYFPSHQLPITDSVGNTTHITGIDGSIFDNPCTSYHGALSQHVDESDNVLMITLGTGYTHRSITKDKWDSYGGLGVVDPVNDLPLINILFHAAESALVESFTDHMGDNLYMFNKPIPPHHMNPEAPSTQIDDASPQNLKALENFAYEMIEENKIRFHEICHHLVRSRDKKHAKRETWLKRMQKRMYFFR